MTRESTLGHQAIREQFHELAELLEMPLTVHLIGGGALTLRDLKNATKDIDLIVESENDLKLLFKILTEAGYEQPSDVSVEYEELDAAFILEKDRRRFDVFNRQVAGELVLTDSMKSRSRHLFEDGTLTVEMVSLNDIFLFKSVANRDDDVDDMLVLVQAGIDERVILDETRVQMQTIEDDSFIGSMKAKLERLEERGYELDIQNDVESLFTELKNADSVYQALASLYEMEYRHDDLYEGVPKSRLERKTDENIDVSAGIEWLRSVGRIETANDGSLYPP